MSTLKAEPNSRWTYTDPVTEHTGKNKTDRVRKTGKDREGEGGREGDRKVEREIEREKRNRRTERERKRQKRKRKRKE